MPKEHISMRYLDKPREEWCRPEHRAIAKELLDFCSSNFTDDDIALEVWDSRKYETVGYTCWWVSFRDANTYKDQNGKTKNCMILNFALHNNKRRPNDADVLFRFVDVVGRDKLNLLGWKTDKVYWYVPFRENKDRLPIAMIAYLKSLRIHFNNGTLPNFYDFKLSNVDEKV